MNSHTLIVLFCIIDGLFSYPGEIIYGCIPAEKEWSTGYSPWGGDNTKNAYAHLTFDDGPELIDTPIILDVLAEYNISATFFIITNQINDTTKPILQRMIDEGHTIGSHSHSHRNLQYMNLTLIKEEVDSATQALIPILGEAPKLFRPPYGSMDVKVQNYLKSQGYTAVLWSAGCVDWWFTDHNIEGNISLAAMRYGLAEEGGIVCMHDRSESPNDGRKLKAFLDAIWSYWDFVDFYECIGRDDVDEVPDTVNDVNEGEIIYGCIPAEKEWSTGYNPWGGDNTKNAYAHLTFDDGPELVDTPIILDVLKEYDISATFFVITNQINDTTKPILQRMIDEGHTIGSHSYSHRNLQYMNLTLIKEEVDLATEALTPILGAKPVLFRPPYGSMSVMVQDYLRSEGYSVVLWSAGCVDWWFTDNNILLNISLAAMRYGLAEEGGIICMHDRSEAPNNGERLKGFLDAIWSYWDFVSFDKCVGRDGSQTATTTTTIESETSKISDSTTGTTGTTGTIDTDIGYIYKCSFSVYILLLYICFLL